MEYTEYTSMNQTQLGQMLNAANKRISELITEKKALEDELAWWKKRHEECEYRKRFEETTDFER